MILSVFVLMAVREFASASVATPLDDKLKNAERVVYYRLTHDRGPSFSLAGRERELSLVTHAILWPEQRFDPAREYRYGVRVALKNESGETTWTRDLYTVTRQSKALPVGGGWAKENSYSLDPRRQITDDRSIRVRLPVGFEANSTLQVTLLGDEVQLGLLRVYGLERRRATDAGIARLSLSPRRRHRLVGGLTYRPWEDLRPDQQAARIRFRKDRMSALGEAGRDYDLESVYFTGFRLPARPPDEDPGDVLAARNVLAYNVWGPAEVEVRGRLDVEGPGQEVGFDVVHVGAVGELDRWSVRLPRAGSASRRVEVPAGPHTFFLGSDSTELLRIHAHAVHAESVADRERLQPRWRRASAHRSGPDRPAVEFAVGSAGDTASRVIRVDARIVGKGDAPLSEPSRPHQVQFDYAMLDRQGRQIGGGNWRSILDEPARSADVLVDDAGPGLQPVSEATSRYLVAPPQAASIRVAADREVLLGASVYFEPASATGRPRAYRLEPDAGSRWRYAPRSVRYWYSQRPINHAKIEATGGRVAVAYQVRLEPKEVTPDGPSPDADAWQVLFAERGSRPLQLSERRLAPDGSRGRRRRRTVYALSPQGVSARVNRQAGERVVVVVGVYGPVPKEDEAEPFAFRVMLDDGTPIRRVGQAVSHYSRGRRTGSIGRDSRRTRARISSAGVRGTLGFSTVSVSLGDDVTAGEHVIRVSSKSEGRGFVRFFVRTEPIEGGTDGARPSEDVPVDEVSGD